MKAYLYATAIDIEDEISFTFFFSFSKVGCQTVNRYTRLRLWLTKPLQKRVCRYVLHRNGGGTLFRKKRKRHKSYFGITVYCHMSFSIEQSVPDNMVPLTGR